MEGYIKAIAAAMITAVLCLILAKQNKDMAILLTIFACVLILTAAAGYMKNLVDFLEQLERLAGIKGEHFEILLKVVGIGLTGEMAAMICADAGNTALGKAVQLLGTVLILCLSLPLFRGLLDLIEGIMGGT